MTYTVETSNHWTLTEQAARNLVIDGKYEFGLFRFKGSKAVGIKLRRGSKWTEYPLNVPLCMGCDAPLENSVCHACQVINADVGFVEVEHLGPGRIAA